MNGEEARKAVVGAMTLEPPSFKEAIRALAEYAKESKLKGDTLRDKLLCAVRIMFLEEFPELPDFIQSAGEDVLKDWAEWKD